MADNITAPASGAILATDEINSVHYPRTKLAFGPDGTATDVSASAPLPVTGTFWQATQPVSLVSQPLPSGASTDATLAAASAKLPASLGPKLGSASLSIAPATDATFALAASESVVGAVAGMADLIDVTLSLNTSGAYASGDVLADTQAVTNAVRINGGQARLDSIMVIDEDDQGQAFDLVFLSANNSLGTENSAVSISDASARDILGFVSVAAEDFIDLGGVKVASLKNVGLMVEAVSGSRIIYVAAISRGTGTYSASGVRLRLGLIWA